MKLENVTVRCHTFGGVVAFLPSRSPLPWDLEYRDILLDALLSDTASEDHADAFYNSLAQVVPVRKVLPRSSSVVLQVYD